MLRAVIFDFDGVIADSERLHLAAFNQLLAPYHIKIEQELYYRDYLGLTDLDLLKELLGKGLLKVEVEQINNLVEQKKQVFERLAGTQCSIFDGVPEFLQMLSKNNVVTAICSGAVRQDITAILKKGELRDFFEVIVSAELVEKGKPHPDGFILTLQKLNENRPESIAAGQCVVIEDSHWGLEAAKAAGMHTVAITNSYDVEQLSMAEKIVTSLNKLSIAALQRICG